MSERRTLYLDNTAMKDAVCDLRMVMRHMAGYRSAEQGIALKCGLDIHTSLERHFKGKPLDKCMGAVDKRYRRFIEQQLGDGTPIAEQYLPDNVSRITRAWIEKHPLGSLPYDTDPAMAEVGAIAKLTADDYCACGHPWRMHSRKVAPHQCNHCPCSAYTEINFCGKLDLIGIDKADRDLVPVDHKTAGRPDARWARQFKLGSQLTGYIWLCEQHSGKRVRRAYVNVIPIEKLNSSDGTCKQHSVPYRECATMEPHHKPVILGPILRSEEQIKEWRRVALRIAHKYSELQLAREGRGTDMKGVRANGIFTDACTWCDYSGYCEGDRPFQAFTNGTLVHDPWDALAHIRGERK